MERSDVLLHGRRVAYRRAGDDGPMVVLVHGITQESSNWEGVARTLSEAARLVAVDLPGHGRSDNPPGDHSIGAYATTVRDLLLALGEHGTTIVGHSLGGGVALQFAYQFPELVHRLVLIDSGGLGEEVSPLLRAATLPGAEPVIRMLASERAGGMALRLSRALRRVGLRVGTDLRQVWQGLSNLGEERARSAFLGTVRTLIGTDGQKVSAVDRLYLAEHVPTLLLWGARDRIIPLHHGERARDHIPGSTLRVLPDAGHFPHLDQPRTVADAIAAFLASTEPCEMSHDEWGAVVRAHATRTGSPEVSDDATRPRT